MNDELKNKNKIKKCIKKYLQALPVSSSREWIAMHFVNLSEIGDLLYEQNIKTGSYILQIYQLLNDLMFGDEKVANFQIFSAHSQGFTFVIIKISELT